MNFTEQFHSNLVVCEAESGVTSLLEEGVWPVRGSGFCLDVCLKTV